MSTDKKRKLQDYLFPEGLYLENNEFRTIKISTILRVIEDKITASQLWLGTVDKVRTRIIEFNGDIFLPELCI